MTAAPRRSHAERTDLSDSRMRDAAIRLIVERGTDRTTLKDVGEHAGYSRGLAGYRFGSKAGLFEFIVRSVGERWLADLKRVTSTRTGFGAIGAAIDAHCQFCLDGADDLRAFYILWFESIGVQSEVKSVIAGIHERRRDDTARWLLEAGMNDANDRHALAAHFNTAVLGIAYQWLAMPDDLDAVKRLHHTLKLTMQLSVNVATADVSSVAATPPRNCDE
ncbi:MAG: helix-turn-helix domain-containing protein [Pseudomonadota bacterium]